MLAIETLPRRFLERFRKQFVWVPQTALSPQTTEKELESSSIDRWMDLFIEW